MADFRGWVDYFPKILLKQGMTNGKSEKIAVIMRAPILARQTPAFGAVVVPDLIRLCGMPRGRTYQVWLQTDMQANDINVMIFWVCAVIGAAVYVAIIWSLVAYRKSRKREASFHKSTATEIAWTVIPLLIIIAMTIPAAKLLTRLYTGETNSARGETRGVAAPERDNLVMLESRK